LEPLCTELRGAMEKNAKINVRVCAAVGGPGGEG
jgi:hypothetical protein